MTQEQLEKSIKLQNKIDIAMRNHQGACYMVASTVVPRVSTLRFLGLDEDDTIIIPESLFKMIGGILLREYEQELRQLKSEFDNL